MSRKRGSRHLRRSALATQGEVRGGRIAVRKQVLDKLREFPDEASQLQAWAEAIAELDSLRDTDFDGMRKVAEDHLEEVDPGVSGDLDLIFKHFERLKHLVCSEGWSDLTMEARSVMLTIAWHSDENGELEATEDHLKALMMITLGELALFTQEMGWSRAYARELMDNGLPE